MTANPLIPLALALALAAPVPLRALQFGTQQVPVQTPPRAGHHRDRRHPSSQRRQARRPDDRIRGRRLRRRLSRAAVRGGRPAARGGRLVPDVHRREGSTGGAARARGRVAGEERHRAPPRPRPGAAQRDRHRRRALRSSGPRRLRQSRSRQHRQGAQRRRRQRLGGRDAASASPSGCPTRLPPARCCSSPSAEKSSACSARRTT